MAVSFCGFMFITLYRSQIAASLAIRVYKPPVTSFEDVLESDHIIMVSEGTSVHTMFTDAPAGSTLNKIVKADKLKPWVSDPNAAQILVDGNTYLRNFIDYFVRQMKIR